MQIKSTTHLLQKIEEFDGIEDSNQQKQHFASYFNYLLSVVGFAVGFGSFWRFPYLVYKNGGGAFLIPYLLAMLFLGIPLFYLEVAVGQMHQQTIPRIYSRINKGLKMCGYFVIFIIIGMAVYYNTLLMYSYRYMFTVFINPLPFANESPLQNIYFQQHILHKSSSIEDFGQIRPDLAFLYIFSLFAVYQILKRGLQFSGKVLIFTVILPYVFLFILLICGMNLEGSSIGLSYLFEPVWSKLLNFEIWVDAVVQVFFQMSISSASIISYSSLKPKNQKFTSIIYIVPISLIVCGLMSGLIIFMFVGHYCFLSGLDIHELSLSGISLAFNVFPKTISILPLPNLLLLVFCMTLVLLGIDTQLAFVQTILRSLQEQFNEREIVILKVTISKQNIKVYIILFLMCFFPFFSCDAGIYYVSYFDSFVVEIGLPLGALLELYIFVYLFKFDKLEQEVFIHTGDRTPKFIKWSLQHIYMVIVLVVVLTILGFRQIMLYEKYSISKYIMGWCISLYPTVIAIWYWHKNKENAYNFTFKTLREESFN